MNILYFFGGLASIVLGVIFLRHVINKFKRKEPDELGFNAKGIMAGLGFILIGVFLIAKAFE